MGKSDLPIENVDIENVESTPDLPFMDGSGEDDTEGEGGESTPEVVEGAESESDIVTSEDSTRTSGNTSDIDTDVVTESEVEMVDDVKIHDVSIEEVEEEEGTLKNNT